MMKVNKTITTMFSVFIILLFVFCLAVHCAERNSACITPNNETARCISIFNCDVIRNSPHHGNPDFLQFVRKSECGFDSEPLYCCGTLGFVPTTEAPKKKVQVNLDVVLVNSLPNRTVCGVERENQRLKGGRETLIDEFPWMSLIRYRNNNDGSDAGFQCGGTLINNKFVLTAAHCILTSPEYLTADSVRLGEWQISTEEDCVRDVAIENCADPVVDVKVKEAIPHSYYDSINGNNDIGLLLLDRVIPYTGFIRPICLPPFDLLPPAVGSSMTVCGWGATEQGHPSDRKLKISVPIVDQTTCRRYISNYTKISANQICAGGERGVDTCQGDSGGPLMKTYLDETSQWYQEGIVSRGLGCGREGVPGIYTRVSRYSVWIINTISDYE